MYGNFVQVVIFVDTISVNQFRDNLKEQETLYVMQNSSLMQQIAQSFVSHNQGAGYTADAEQLREITENQIF